MTPRTEMGVGKPPSVMVPLLSKRSKKIRRTHGQTAMVNVKVNPLLNVKSKINVNPLHLL